LIQPKSKIDSTNK